MLCVNDNYIKTCERARAHHAVETQPKQKPISSKGPKYTSAGGTGLFGAATRERRRLVGRCEDNYDLRRELPDARAEVKEDKVVIVVVPFVVAVASTPAVDRAVPNPAVFASRGRRLAAAARRIARAVAEARGLGGVAVVEVEVPRELARAERRDLAVCRCVELRTRRVGAGLARADRRRRRLAAAPRREWARVRPRRGVDQRVLVHARAVAVAAAPVERERFVDRRAMALSCRASERRRRDHRTALDPPLEEPEVEARRGRAVVGGATALGAARRTEASAALSIAQITSSRRARRRGPPRRVEGARSERHNREHQQKAACPHQPRGRTVARLQGKLETASFVTIYAIDDIITVFVQLYFIL